MSSLVEQSLDHGNLVIESEEEQQVKALKRLKETTMCKYGQKICRMGKNNKGSNGPIFVRREINSKRMRKATRSLTGPYLMVTHRCLCHLLWCNVRASQKEELCLLVLDTLAPHVLSPCSGKRELGQPVLAHQHAWHYPLTSTITHLSPWVKSKSFDFICS